MTGGSTGLFRVLDVNLNRAREGLRVCEEVARLILDDDGLTRKCQRLRYAVDRTAKLLSGGRLLQARDSSRDVGRPGRRGVVRPHGKILDLLTANLRRVQEALRVLEEFSRLVEPAASRSFGSLRFRVYTLEQTFHSKSAALRHR